jgi:hypothetical protein
LACFHLHQRRGSAVIPDKEGADWPEITDEYDRLLMRVTFADAVQLRR